LLASGDELAVAEGDVAERAIGIAVVAAAAPARGDRQRERNRK
jgi:hypothetical protein